MSIRRATWVVCDLCRKKGPDGADELSACRAARKARWQTVVFDHYGNEGHVCPRCAKGKTEHELYADIMMTGEKVGE